MAWIQDLNLLPVLQNFQVIRGDSFCSRYTVSGVSKNFSAFIFKAASYYLIMKALDLLKRPVQYA
jgi:hypothetical protein